MRIQPIATGVTPSPKALSKAAATFNELLGGAEGPAATLRSVPLPHDTDPWTAVEPDPSIAVEPDTDPDDVKTEVGVRGLSLDRWLALALTPSPEPVRVEVRPEASLGGDAALAQRDRATLLVEGRSTPSRRGRPPLVEHLRAARADTQVDVPPQAKRGGAETPAHREPSTRAGVEPPKGGAEASIKGRPEVTSGGASVRVAAPETSLEVALETALAAEPSRAAATTVRARALAPVAPSTEAEAAKAAATLVPLPIPMEGNRVTVPEIAPIRATRADLDPATEVVRGRIENGRADLIIGEGRDKIELSIVALGSRIEMSARAASPEATRALITSLSELRAALGGHGLALGAFNASSGEREQPREPAREPLPSRESPSQGAKSPRPTRRNGIVI